MRIGFFMYNTSPLFEIVTAKYLLQTKHDTYIVAEEGEILSAENINIKSDFKLSDDIAKHLDVLIIAGGDTDMVADISKINSLINTMYSNNKLVASICSGNKILLDALDKKNDDISGIKTIEKNVICSSADASTNFGIYLGSILNIYEDDDDFFETIQFFGW